MQFFNSSYLHALSLYNNKITAHILPLVHNTLSITRAQQIILRVYNRRIKYVITLHFVNHDEK